MAMFSCSSDSEGDGTTIVNPSDELMGVYTIGNYDITFLNNNFFRAKDNVTGAQYNGTYTYNAPNLTMSDVMLSRAFQLEEGKVYSFNVERNGKDIVLTNNETGEKIELKYVSDAPKAEDTQLTPAEEKAYINATGNSLKQYFVSSEWDYFSNLINELREIDASALEDYVDEITMSTFRETQSYTSTWFRYDRFDPQSGPIYYKETSTYNYNYYNKVLLTSQAKGKFVGSYSSKKWMKVGDSNNIEITYTDKNNVTWVFSETKSGDIGAITLEDWNYDDKSYNTDIEPYTPTGTILEGGSNTYEMGRHYYFVHFPQYIKATVTRNGETVVETTIDVKEINSAVQANGTMSLFGKAKGTIDLMVKPQGEAFNIHTDFDYANASTTTVNATMSRGNVMLLSSKITGNCTASAAHDVASLKDVNIETNILGRMCIVMSFAEGRTVFDKMSEAEKDDESLQKFTIAKDAFNKDITAYITNGNASSVRQAEIKLDIKYQEYNYASNIGSESGSIRYYDFFPVLRFSDGSSYAFEDYFTESYFKSIIDYSKNAYDDIKIKGGFGHVYDTK